MYAFKSVPFKDTTNPAEAGVIILNSSTVAEDSAAEWSSVANYTAGNVVKVTTQHKRYEAITSNTNKPPASNLGTDWIELGATNRWKAFDKSVQARTVADDANGITYEFTANTTFTAIALFNLAGAQVSVVVKPVGAGRWDDSTPTNDPNYAPDIDLDNRVIPLLDTSLFTDWYEYFYAESEAQSKLLITGLPGYSGSTFTLSITGVAQAAVGEIAVGRMQTIGMTAWGSQIETLDFSRVEEDVFGNVTILRRNSAKRVKFAASWNSADTGRVDRILDDLRSEPAVFAAMLCDDPYGFFVYGFYQTYDINVANPALSYATIEVRTLI